MMEAFEQIDTAMLLTWAWKLLGAILIFVIGRWVIMIITGTLRRLMSRRGMDSMLVDFLGTILYVILLIAVIISAVSYTGIPVTPLVAILGAAGLAVGLALQGSLSNFASGVMLVSFHPFGVGDFVEAGGISGTVMRVGIFNTTLRTPDNKRIIVPNRTITDSAITNFSAHDTRRIDLVIGVHYEDDLQVAKKTIAEALEQHPKVLDEPAPVIMLLELGDSSVDFAVRPWVASTDFWPVRGELLEQIKVALESNGCSIPFPQRDVHVYGNQPAGERDEQNA